MCVCVSGLRSLISFKWWSYCVCISCHRGPHPHMWESESLPTIRNQTSEKPADIFLAYTKWASQARSEHGRSRWLWMSSISKDLLYDHGSLVVITVPAKNKKAHRRWSQERRHSVCAAPCWLRRLTRAALSREFLFSPHLLLLFISVFTPL